MTQYGQFYAYLHSVVDTQITKVLDTLVANGLINGTSCSEPRIMANWA